MYLGYQPNELIVKEENVEITGMYGDRWRNRRYSKDYITRSDAENHFKGKWIWHGSRFQKAILTFLHMEVACYLFKNNPPIF